MPTVSEKLREAREAQGLDVHQVAEITKIKTEHVRAIENGEFEVFTAPIYIRGFVRTFARTVKLDEHEILNQLADELSHSQKLSEPPSLAGPARGPIDWIMYQLSRLNWPIIAPLLAVLIIGGVAVGGYRIYKNIQARDPLADLGPGIYETDPSKFPNTAPLPRN